jgi:hypothetical protein
MKVNEGPLKLCNMGAPKATTTANLHALPTPLESETKIEADGRVATQRRSATQPGAKNEPEKRFCKVGAEAGSLWPSRLEWIALLFLVILALAALACCLSELSYFLDSCHAAR